MRYEELSTAAQVRRLRATALTVLAEWPILVRRIRLLLHGYNTTFRVDTADGRRFALRLNVNSHRTDANRAAETAWLTALSADTDLRLPMPQPTRTGALVAHVHSPDLGRALPATLFSWLPGPTLDDGDPTESQMRVVGRAMATLHDHAESWRLPAGAALPMIDNVLMGTSSNLDTDHELLTPERRAVIDAAFAETGRRYAEIFTGASPMALHADLHNGNLKWCRGKLYVFDFDDSGHGLPMQDLAIAAYYLRDDDHLEAALIDGYAEIRALPAFSTAQYEAIVASRNLVLLNDVLTIATADMRAIMPRYVANTVTKLRHYLDHGVYRHEVLGLLE